MNNLETEIQDVAPAEHQGSQVERLVQMVRNLSKTLVHRAEKENKLKITSGKYVTPWLNKTCYVYIRAEQMCNAQKKAPFE